MPTEKLSFKDRRGERAEARLALPVDGAPIAYALFAHGFGPAEETPAAGRISRALCREGIGVMQLEMLDEEGEAAVEKITAAAGALAEAYEAPAFLIGHAQGGAAALQAAGRMGPVRAVATIGAPATEEAKEAAGSLDAALLLLHSPVDNIIGIDNAAALFTAARHPKSFLSLDEADHRLADPADADHAGRVLAAWAEKYLDAPQSAVKEGAPEDNRITARTGAGGLYTEVLANGHALTADEPDTVEGGTNRGPTPYDYLAVALGACTSMTLRMYADRKQWPLEEALVRVLHRKVHARDCADCEKESSKLDRFERELELAGPLDEAQRKRLLEIANRCPVHRTLHGEVEVHTLLKEATSSSR